MLIKIQCNEQWPACGACLKSKLRCPGPPERHRIIFENFDTASPTKILIQRPIPASWTSILAAELVYAMSSDTPKHNLSYLGRYMQDVPAMLQDSPALTACVAFAVDTQKRASGRPVQGHKMDCNLYQRALRSLRKALKCSEGMKKTTNLLATVIMHRLEVSKCSKFARTLANQGHNHGFWSSRS